MPARSSPTLLKVTRSKGRYFSLWQWKGTCPPVVQCLQLASAMEKGTSPRTSIRWHVAIVLHMSSSHDYQSPEHTRTL